MTRGFLKQLICVAGAGFLCSMLAWAAVTPGGKSARVEADNYTLETAAGFYSLTARDADLRDVLDQLVRISGVAIQVDPALHRMVSVNLHHVKLDKLLNALTDSQAYVFQRDGSTERLVNVLLTSQQKPQAAAGAVSTITTPEPVRTPAEDAELKARGVLTNSRKPVSEMTKRDAAFILLANAYIDTEAAGKGQAVDVPPEFQAAEDTEYYIVQFARAVSEDDCRALEALGAQVSHYIPHYAYAIHLQPSQLGAVRKLAGVRYVGPYHPYYKLNSTVLSYLTGKTGAADDALITNGVFQVMTFRGASAREAVEKAGATVVAEQAADGRAVLTIKTTPDRLTALVRADAVQWVEPQYPRQAMNDLSTKRIRARAVRANHPGLDGSGVIVGVTDTGIDFMNPGFSIDQNLPSTTGLNSRIKSYYFRSGGPTSDGMPGDNNGHGTHVSGSILGNGALSATVNKAPGSGVAPYGTNQFAGVAPGARVIMIEDFNSYSDTEQAELTYRGGGRLSNNSWGNSVYEYGTMCALWDALVRDADSSAAGRQELTAFFAAGNAGNGGDEGVGGIPSTVGQPGNAKNVISIGALEQTRLANNLVDWLFNGTPYNSVKKTDSDWQVASYSSRGPVTPTDARVKPDLVAPGSYVLSIQSHETMPDLLEGVPPNINTDYRYGNVDSGTNFAFFNGTSMATPQAVGAGALIYQYYTNTFGKAPSPAMMKAIMVGGARMVHSLVYYYPRGGMLPSVVDQGWGIVDVERAVDGPRIRMSDTIQFLDQEQTAALYTDGIYSYQQVVNEGEGGLKVVLAWSDVAGTPGNAVQLVNDLDLAVWGPNGMVYQGNFFGYDGVHSYALDQYYPGYADAFNNVEVVTIRDAPVGTYTIQVRGHQVPSGPQDFALSVMKGIGNEGRTRGDSPAVALDTNGAPVVALSSKMNTYSSTNMQIFVQRWVGTAGSGDDLGKWLRMDDQWFGMAGSADQNGAGISRTIADSIQPSIAVNGQKIYVAWVELAHSPITLSRIYLRMFDGQAWVELGNSAHDAGLSTNVIYSATNPVVRVAGDGNPVVAWRENYKLHASKWNGSNWVKIADSVGTTVMDLDMAIQTNGQPVIAYADATPKRILIQQWNGTSWVSLGTQGFDSYVDKPALNIGKDGTIYLAWRQIASGNPYVQIYASRYNGSWSALGGSTTYPGVSGSTNTSTWPGRPSIGATFNNQVIVSWPAGTNPANAVLVKKYTGSAWVGMAGADIPPGIVALNGLSDQSAMVVDAYGLPTVVFQSSGAISNVTEILAYTMVGDKEAPRFGGLISAVGGTNNNVVLTWSNAVDNVSTTILYHIFRGTQTWACGVTPTPSVDDVFSHRIAIVTNVTSFTNLGLGNLTYSFGVRAADTNDLIEGNTVIRSAAPVVGTGDSDGDCLSNLVEYAVGTDSCNPDTDGDGMRDGWEWFYSTNNPAHTGILAMDPLDSGLVNLRSGQAANTNQLPYADPDSDGATSLEEYQWYVAHTNVCLTWTAVLVSPDPTVADTDGDGMPDGWEMINGLNPLNPADAAGDPDADGLSNLNEYLWGANPNSRDSDSDGLSDGTEVLLHKTHPARADTDGDGLDDNAEIALGSNPSVADSRGRGVSDGDAYQLGYSPTAGVTNFGMLLSENFETATRTNWAHRPMPAFPFDLWHLSQAEPLRNKSGVQYMYDHSTNVAYRFADDVPMGTNMLAGYTKNGLVAPLRAVLESPSSDASSNRTLFVSWNENYDTEPNGDFIQVFARGGSNTNWFPVTAAVSGRSGVDNLNNTNEPAQWTHRTADISRFAGMSNVQVRFLFTANGINNHFHGWYVDDVMIYEATWIYGWVRDINGAPIAGARVQAIGRGGVTNIISGHGVVLPGKVFGEATVEDDGEYRITGLPQGYYYVKASEPAHSAEFFNGPLFIDPYGFGQGLNPGVYDRNLVGAAGVLNLTARGAGVTDCHFELEKGKGRAGLGVTMSSIPIAGDARNVYLNGRLTNHLGRIWDGTANTNKTANDFAIYQAALNPALTNNFPDWITLPVRPNLLGDVAPGAHMVYVGTAAGTYPPPVVNLREGETCLVDVRTNQAAGFLTVRTEDGLAYPVLIDEVAVTNQTPIGRLSLPAGEHSVMLVLTNGYRIAPKSFLVNYAQRTSLLFTSNDVAGPYGATSVNTVDQRGNDVAGAEIYVDGTMVALTEIVGGATNRTPATVGYLRPGQHILTVKLNGYRSSERRAINIFAGVTNAFQVTLYDADCDYDRVGDQTEIAGYTNIFRYARNADPDGDGLANLYEYDQFRLYNIFLNPFNPDTDGDTMSDGAELGYDGLVDRLAVSTLRTNVAQDTPAVPVFFTGHYLDGVDNFGNGPVNASIDGDRFIANSVSHPFLTMPAVARAESLLEGISAYGSDQAVSEGHNIGALVFADAMPDRVDTDGDSMWDGFEYTYGLATAAKLDPIENARRTEDPDGDELSNFSEFLGLDGVANTNDWTSPINPDSDGDGLPDGWEVKYGFNPLNWLDAWSDPDGDELSNFGEYYYGTNPKLSDTDADFLPDGAEVLTYGSDPLAVDTDLDGLLDGREVWDKNMDGVRDGGFFPNWAGGDLDGDGFVDGPTDWDTDGDGMPDGFEVIDAFGNLRNDSRLDPYNPYDGAYDPDGDGLSNLQEYLVRDTLYGYNPSGITWDYSTDPFDADSDDDGLPDGWEVVKGLHPMDPMPIDYYNAGELGGGGPDPDYIVGADGQTWVRRYKALGPEGDLDGDGLWNQREYDVRFHLDSRADANAIDSLSTDPWNPDTDSDGLNDGDEDRAMRANPIVQDTDADRLMDGVAVSNRWGEIESAPRHDEFAVVTATMSWKDAWTSAVVSHADFTGSTYSNIMGHLAVFSDPMDFMNVVPTLPLTGAAIAIGGRNPTNKSDRNWSWINGEVFYGPDLYPFTGGSVDNTFDTNNIENQLVLDNMGMAYCINTSAPIDEYVIEWNDVPTATNHFDRALNDLWKLVWPSKDDLPHWEPVKPSKNSPLPPPRWGAAMSYIPVFETKNPRNDNTGNILMDNRQLVVIGGRDGANHYPDVWEFAIRSNIWMRSKAPLDSLAAGYINGISEACAVTMFDYKNTKVSECPCKEQPYDCDSTTFGLPKNRPYSDSRSMDWTFLFGGWDGAYSYYHGSCFYKSTDSKDAIVESNSPTKQVTQILEMATTNRQAKEYSSIVPIGFGIVTIDNTLVQVDGYNGFHFSGVALRPTCEEIVHADLTFDVETPPAADLNLTLVGEVLARSGGSPEDYNADRPRNLPSARLGGSYFNTTNLDFTIPAGTTGKMTLNVTTQLQQLVQFANWGGDQLGFVLSGNSSYAELYRPGTVLSVVYRPFYKLDPYWASPSRITTIYQTERMSARKSTGMAYDYKRKRLVVFGGIDGNTVKGDTHEGEVSFSSGQPSTLTWNQMITANAPSPRWGHSMVYDAHNERVVLFGGFNADHKPLNDLWSYRLPIITMTVTNIENGVTNIVDQTVTNAAEWTLLSNFQNLELPQPRGGASLVYWGDYDYDRAIADYSVGANKKKIVLFGGTDGKAYFNDTWVYDETSGSAPDGRWVQVNPVGELSQGPSPRAFAAMVWAQNGRSTKDLKGRYTFRASNTSEDETDDEGEVTTDLGTPPKSAKPAVYLFGGRCGTVPTTRDTDWDLVDDGMEYELGGPAAGRNPTVNRLIEKTNAFESLPFVFNRIGPIPRLMSMPDALLNRAAVADMESLRNDDGVYAAKYGLPYQFYAESDAVLKVIPGLPEIGVDAERVDQVDLWYHRYSIEDPFNGKDVWERGRPNNSGLGSNGAPPYAHSGRWVYATKLDGSYPNDAQMELFSPVINLTIPPVNGTSTNNFNNYFLVFYEWLDLADSNDVVRIDAVRPKTPADLSTRVTGVGKPSLPVLPNRNNIYNTRGDWRRVLAPLDNLANESNVFLRFTLQSDARNTAGGWYIDDVAVLQGGEISGLVTNLANIQLKLLGVNYNGNSITSTWTDATGFFQFGMLPLGQYAFGTLSEGSPNLEISGTNVEDLVMDIGPHGSVEVTWPTLPGCTYRLDYAEKLQGKSLQWQPLQMALATGMTASYVDAAATPWRVYRAVLISQ